MERTEAPTDSRRMALRRQGVVPYSWVTTACARSFLGVVAVVFIVGSFTHTFSAWVALFELVPGASSDRQALIRVVVSNCIRAIIIPVVVGALAALVTGMFQTGFLFVPARAWGRFIRSTGSSGRSVSILLQGILLGGGVVSGVVFFSLYVPFVVGVLNLRREEIFGWAGALLHLLAVPLVLGIGVLGLVAWGAARFQFLRDHRMTRGEVTAESIDEDS